MKFIKNTAIVYAKLPRAGLGNLLLVWARALVFANLNDLPVVVSGWNKLHIGPWLRREKIKRFYGLYFRQNFIFTILYSELKCKMSPPNKLEVEPKLIKLDELLINNATVFLFSRISHWSEFKELKPYKELIKQALYNMLRQKQRDKIKNIESPVIGVHIRLSDFRKANEVESLFTAGAIRTQMSYFIEQINNIRMKAGAYLPVTVFSDGHKHELAEILALENVTLAKNNSDIVDMLQLSKSKYIIPSAKSTFSYWSAFLSEAEIIFHPCHNEPPF